jgi:hypothetical protein
VKITAIVEALVLAGATPDMILCAVRAAENGDGEVAAAKREAARQRQIKHRAAQRHVMSRDVTVTERDSCDDGRNVNENNGPVTPQSQPSREPAHVEDNLPTKNLSGKKEERKQEGARDQFDTFWALFPNKVGKRDAEREFASALKRSSFDDIMAGLRRYVAKTDDRPWCNPSTFLHQDRWSDQPAVQPQHRSTAPPGRTVFDVLDDLKTGKLDVPDLLNGKSHEHNGPTINTSFERSDRGSTGYSAQVHALPSRSRS